MNLGGSLPPRVEVVDVGMRDGLQALDHVVPTNQKMELIHGLIEAGVREIEAVSFAHPDVIPQVADAERVVAGLPRVDGVRYRGLVPNLRGAQRAAECDLDLWVLVVAADDEVSLRNQGRPTQAVLRDLDPIGELAREQGVELIVAVACAFFAPGSGPTPATRRSDVLRAAVGAGASGFYLAGTTGMEHPLEIFEGVKEAKTCHPGHRVGVHLHNRNGFGSANALAALLAGADWLEAAFCGYGGDPWFPGDPMVLGNYPMEDLVHLCSSLDIDTGVDLEAYRRVVQRAAAVTGVPAHSFVARAGTRQELEDYVWPESSRW